MSSKEKCNCISGPQIIMSQYGPYMIVDLDEIINSKGESLKIEPVTSICRCGESKYKPHCDGAHHPARFSGEKKDDRIEDKVKDYTGSEITAHYNHGVCSHDGSCLKLPTVFDRDKRPWINADGDSVKKIISTIEKCPSGALSYTLTTKRVQNFGQEDAKIIISKDGPLQIQG